MVVDSGSAHKKPRKEKGDKKGKHAADSEFRTVSASVVLTVPPVFASKPRDGAEEMLDSLIMRYEPTLRGVVLSHSNMQFLQNVGVVKGDSPFAVCNVGFDAMLWSPELGMKLTGRVNLSSPDHVSLLVHRTFNVSIPRHHIPSEQWEFEYGPAENDPEFGEGATAVEEAVPDAAEEGNEDRRGRWVHKVTGDRLGGEERLLEFTVVSLTVANQMLSLVGSIQPDPFSPSHVPQPAARAHSPVAQTGAVEADASDEEGHLDDVQLEQQATEEQLKAEKKRAKEERKRKRREEKEKHGQDEKQSKRKKA
ncbi:hypothetical protein BV25DRAFT_1797566 [Artomyces pyxidatus]|uniref:Uncharacterized protein n=1 Tax=Artomyces pyxidatus TaxID=48021 RepID=A0ACB8TBK3_9AGAM|nr:hypothetical protein BV25DRAFT_1797566 [Artomyces pyxidatus]